MTINLITQSWDLIESMEIIYIPRAGELIYSHEKKKYFRVVNVVHHTYTYRNIFYIKRIKQVINIIVEDIEQQTNGK
jgi:uncharacterized C2H2 Zn-finger protein